MSSKTIVVKTEKAKVKKTRRHVVNSCTISSGAVLASLTGKIDLPSLNMTDEELMNSVISQMQPAVYLRDVMAPKFAELTSNLSEFRTRYAVQNLHIEVTHEGDYDDESLKILLCAHTDPKAAPDRPSLTGAQARKILENCFEDFHVEVNMPDVGDPTYQQKTILSYDLYGGNVHDVPWSLPTTDPRQLYVNIVHNICGVIQQHGSAIERIYVNMDGQENHAVTPDEFRVHVQSRNGHEEPVTKKKKVTRTK